MSKDVIGNQYLENISTKLNNFIDLKSNYLKSIGGDLIEF